MKPELAIAIYGAVVATAVALWNAYTWRHANKLYLSGFTASDMKFDDAAARRAGVAPHENLFVVLCVSNRGGVPCRVNTVWLLTYTSWWRFLRGKPSNTIHVVRPASELFGCPVPYELERGGEFRAMALQNAELEHLSRSTRLYAAVSHSMSKRPFRVRVAAIAERQAAGMDARRAA